MGKYRFAIPRPRGAVVPQSSPFDNIVAADTIIKDLILHAIIVRLAYTDGNTEEFRPQLLNDLFEIDIPQERLDLITNIEVGPKIQ